MQKWQMITTNNPKGKEVLSKDFQIEDKAKN